MYCTACLKLKELENVLSHLLSWSKALPGNWLLSASLRQLICSQHHLCSLACLRMPLSSLYCLLLREKNLLNMVSLGDFMKHSQLFKELHCRNEWLEVRGNCSTQRPTSCAQALPTKGLSAFQNSVPKLKQEFKTQIYGRFSRFEPQQIWKLYLQVMS